MMVMIDDELGNNRERWGTWEELLLGGAVVRHGCTDWVSVASELQARTLYPSLFTPQVCKAKFEDLQERYSGNSFWFEELRKRRVEELRTVLEKSEDSIGSLETKLDSLKDEKGTYNNGDYSSSQTESPVFLKSEGNESSGKEVSKDGLSAGSSTQETRLNRSSQCEADNSKSIAKDTKRKHESGEKAKKKHEVEEKVPSRLEKFSSIDKLEETIRSEGGLSAGSFTREAQLTRSPQCEADNIKSFAKDSKRKHEAGEKAKKKHEVEEKVSSRLEKFSSIDKLEDTIRSEGGLSAGSFTREVQPNWSPQCEADNTKSFAEDTKRKHEVEEEAPRLEKFPSIDKLEETIRSEGGVSIRRRRGKRRRKDLSNSNNGRKEEGSIGESNLLGSPDIAISVMPLINENEQPAILPLATDYQDPCTSKHDDTDTLLKVLDSLMENEHASVFRRRLDSQKRARYKKMILQHMDLDTIRGRIKKRAITSLIELHRDLLLLANNSLIFYSKSTREYKCAFILRDLIKKKIHKHRPKRVTNNSINKPLITPGTPMCKPPAKPRSVRPFHQKNATVKEAKRGPPSNVDSPSSAESSAVVKKSQGRKGKVRRASAGLQAETPMKVRRKARVK